MKKHCHTFSRSSTGVKTQHDSAADLTHLRVSTKELNYQHATAKENLVQSRSTAENSNFLAKIK